MGRHFYESFGSRHEGVSSGYLIATKDPIRIKKIAARSFRLPQNATRPIIMFAAGTGISPFLGFIEARKAERTFGKNVLFFCTTDRESFYYEAELKAAVRKNLLELSVIFSRDAVDSLVFDALTQQFSYALQYKTKHIDAPMQAAAKTLATLILNEDAHIYVCGNAGFAELVKETLISILYDYKVQDLGEIYENLSKEAVEAEVHALMANQRYEVDQFSQLSLNPKDHRMHLSEVAYHNKPNDCWITLNGWVYGLK